MGYKEITRKVISYCEIPQKLTEENCQLNEASCDVYVEFTVTSKEDQLKYDNEFDVQNWIIYTYPELEGETIFIHIDY